ncbi:tyrosine-protein kinase Btk29A-like isoform X1 [Varroa destructor]|uniref:Tyrosine-protein kinase n=2 Tax=Varroa destructor TaxID=109461 RepID=A0A7M7KQ86_VARDE|nr:tyrosine-protein kinase Btk29A-like isoform X1 [Varroa destructor]XP_022669195.1 tyrosine-protein kinase Btk29A-like isoform X1 [Varroa destructor]
MSCCDFGVWCNPLMWPSSCLALSDDGGRSVDSDEQEIIKQALMIKRSVNRKRLGPVNYKARWFVLTKSCLTYYEGTLEKRGREKGRIPLSSIRLIEYVNDEAIDKKYVFQIGFEAEHILYVVASSAEQRDEWICALRKFCTDNQCLVDKYHAKLWSGSKWACCGDPSRSSCGCQPTWVTKPLTSFFKNKLNSSSRSSASCSSPSKKNVHTVESMGLIQRSGSNSSLDVTLPRAHHLSRKKVSESLRDGIGEGNSNMSSLENATKLALIMAYNQENKNGSSSNNNNWSSVSSNHHNVHHQNGHNNNSNNNNSSSSSSSNNNNNNVNNANNNNHHYSSSSSASSTSARNTAATIGNNVGSTTNGSSSATRKTVIALFDFEAQEDGDLSLKRGEEYEVMDDSGEHWWQVRSASGESGYIPSNYVQEQTVKGLWRHEWYAGDMSRQKAEVLLRQEGREGCFVIRNSSTNGMYTLSLFTKIPGPQVKHYHVKSNASGELYLSERHRFKSLEELVFYHKHDSGGLATRLKFAPASLQKMQQRQQAGSSNGISSDKWEIDPSELSLLEELGSGQFGVVRRGRWRQSKDVAVKMMKEGTMSEDDFIEEAKVMTKLQHPNLVQLFGVCSKQRPILIVAEYMRFGSLLNYLRRHETRLQAQKPHVLLDMCIQVCSGMAYLEMHNYIHRDLAARNCLVGEGNVVKVADFGLARYVIDDEYTSSGGTKFPIKWAPPEVLGYTRFSSKSDVWAYGVLMWEVFTCGKIPYGRASNAEVVEFVQRGQRLDRPRTCPRDVYNVMKLCWEKYPEGRPTFRGVKAQLDRIMDDPNF